MHFLTIMVVNNLPLLYFVRDRVIMIKLSFFSKNQAIIKFLVSCKVKFDQNSEHFRK